MTPTFHPCTAPVRARGPLPVGKVSSKERTNRRGKKVSPRLGEGTSQKLGLYHAPAPAQNDPRSSRFPALRISKSRPRLHKSLSTSRPYITGPARLPRIVTVHDLPLSPWMSSPSPFQRHPPTSQRSSLAPRPALLSRSIFSPRTRPCATSSAIARHRDAHQSASPRQDEPPAPQSPSVPDEPQRPSETKQEKHSQSRNSDDGPITGV